MSYIKKYARWNSTSFQLPIYPNSTTKEELGKIHMTDDFKFEWYVNPSACYENEWDVVYTQWGTEDSFKDAKEKIESFMK